MYKVSVPIMISRYPDVKKEDWLFELKRAKADRVFLDVCRSVDEENEKKRQLGILRELILFFENEGFEVGVWTSSLGHGGWGNYGHLGYTRITGVNGETQSDSFCPLDTEFGDEFCKWLADIARTGAKMIMLDDDYRLSYRAGALGCACPLHLKEIAMITGEELSREELAAKALSGKPNKYRAAWLDAAGNSLKNLAHRLRSAVDEVDESIRLGHCAVLSTWDVDGVSSIELAKIFAGKTEPFLRLIGAPYWGVSKYWGCRLGSIIELERLQAYWCENEGIEIFSEGDVFPRPRYVVPAAYLEGFDTALRAAGSPDGILKYMIDYYSSAFYETGYIDRHVRHFPLFAEIEKHFTFKKPCGVRVFEAMRKLGSAELPDKFPGGAYISETFLSAAGRFLCDNSIPMQYSQPAVTVIFGENARYADENDLKNGAVLDAPAAKIFAERGVDTGLAAVSESVEALFEYYPEQNERVPITGSFFRLKVKDGARYVTELCSAENFGGAYEYENADGIRFLVYPFNAYETMKNSRAFRCYCRQAQLIKSLQFINGGGIEAVCPGNPDLYMLCKKDESSLSVGLWNFFEDEIFAPKIFLGKKYEKAEYINCSGELNGDTVIISDIPPFGFAGVVLC